MVSIIKIVKITTVLLLVSIIASSSYNNNNNNNNNNIVATAASTLSQSAQKVLPLSDQSFGGNGRTSNRSITSNSNSTVNLSNENSFDQQIAALGNKSYVVWADETTGNGDIYFKRSRDGGATFSSTTINLSNNTGSSVNPKISAAPSSVSGSNSNNNNVYVVWVDETTGNNEILFKRSTDNGTSFSDTPINLSNNTGISSTPQIMTSGNNVYVVWSDQSTGDGDIYFRTSTDGGATFAGYNN